MRRRSRVAQALSTIGGLTVAATLCGACTPDFDDEWLIKDLRVMGIAAEPPEQLLRVDDDTLQSGSQQAILAALLAQLQPTSLSVLAADPTDAQRELDWELWACTPEEGFCDDDAARADLVQRGRGRVDQISAQYLPDPGLVAAAFESDPFRGFGGLPLVVEFRLQVPDQPDPQVRGYKRLVYTFPLPYSPIPEAKTPNANPAIDRVTANGEDLDPDTALQVKPGQEVVFEPIPTADSKQVYWVATAEDPLTMEVGEPTLGEQQLEEYLSYTFITTAGKLSHGATGGRPSPFVDNKKVDDVTSIWTAPSGDGAPTEATLWIVIRDDRGGSSWVSFEVTIAP